MHTAVHTVQCALHRTTVLLHSDGLLLTAAGVSPEGLQPLALRWLEAVEMDGGYMLDAEYRATKVDTGWIQQN